MTYLTERVSEAEARSEELQQFFAELSKTTRFAVEDKEEYTVQQFIDLCFLHTGRLGKPRKISQDMLNAVDFGDEYLLRRKVTTLGPALFTLCREIAAATRCEPLEKRRQSLYVFLNSAITRNHARN